MKKLLLKENMFFYIILVLNTFPVLLVKYFYTIDGPSHFYNATLIKDLILGNSPLVTSLYKFNSMIPPNWTGHFIFSILSLFFNAALTEKIFTLLFIIFLPVSFRYLVKTISPSTRTLSYLIFPFTYTYLYEAGFFNFCISFIFLFLSLGYWYKHEGKFHIRQILLLSFLLILTFFSHILVFAVLEMLIVLITIGNELKENNNRKLLFANLFRRLSVLILASIPALILMINFFLKITPHSSNERFSSHELWMWVTNVKPLVLFNFTVESKISHYFALIYLAIFLYSVILRIKKIYENRAENTSFILAIRDSLFVTDLILLASFFILALLFLIPDGASAGMMSERLCLFFFILWITWLAIQTLPKWFYILIVIATLGVDTYLINAHWPGYKDLSNYACEINKAAQNIRNESIVYKVNWNDHWMLGHITDYLGTDKPIILTNNYEAELKWFPLVYKDKNLPKFIFDDQQFVKGISWGSNSDSSRVRKIDYIFIFGNILKLDEPKFQGLKNGLMKNYSLVYSSTNHAYLLYALKVNKKS
jgi:hypothetical protein